MTEDQSIDKKHLELFMYRVQQMRDLQKAFFNGNRGVLVESKKAEAAVDNALKKLMDYNYTPQEPVKPPTQPKLL